MRTYEQLTQDAEHLHAALARATDSLMARGQWHETYALIDRADANLACAVIFAHNADTFLRDAYTDMSRAYLRINGQV